jgi:hypothetical protein
MFAVLLSAFEQAPFDDFDQVTAGATRWSRSVNRQPGLRRSRFRFARPLRLDGACAPREWLCGRRVVWALIGPRRHNRRFPFGAHGLSFCRLARFFLRLGEWCAPVIFGRGVASGGRLLVDRRRAFFLCLAFVTLRRHAQHAHRALALFLVAPAFLNLMPSVDTQRTPE